MCLVLSKHIPVMEAFHVQLLEKFSAHFTILEYNWKLAFNFQSKDNSSTAVFISIEMALFWSFLFFISLSNVSKLLSFISSLSPFMTWVYFAFLVVMFMSFHLKLLDMINYNLTLGLAIFLDTPRPWKIFVCPHAPLLHLLTWPLMIMIIHLLDVK